MTTRPSPDRPTLVARCAEDLLAMVPVVLGFHPEESVVLLTFGPRGRAFQARVDLPTRAEDVPEVVDLLLEPTIRHRVTQSAVVAYTDDELRGATMVADLVDSLDEAGVRVRDALLVSGGRWFRCFDGYEPDAGVPFDISAHPFLVDAVVRGDVTHESREELRRTVAPEAGAVAAVARTLWIARPPLEAVQRPAEVAWALATVSTALADPGSVTTQVAARLLSGLRDVELRDHVWFALTRESATEHLALWTRLVRCAPDGFVAAPATLLGFAAWLAGQGALAWCALDRCFADSPGEPLALALAEGLAGAVPPSVWDDPRSGARA